MEVQRSPPSQDLPPSGERFPGGPERVGAGPVPHPSRGRPPPRPGPPLPVPSVCPPFLAVGAAPSQIPGSASRVHTAPPSHSPTLSLQDLHGGERSLRPMPPAVEPQKPEPGGPQESQTPPTRGSRSSLAERQGPACAQAGSSGRSQPEDWGNASPWWALGWCDPSRLEFPQGGEWAGHRIWRCTQVPLPWGLLVPTPLRDSGGPSRRVVGVGAGGREDFLELAA